MFRYHLNGSILEIFCALRSPRCDGPTRPKNYTVNFLTVLNMPTKFHQNRTRRPRVGAVCKQVWEFNEISDVTTS
ncbi:hypothetical protein WDU94_000904, partial [Cyamophila willieti]